MLLVVVGGLLVTLLIYTLARQVGGSGYQNEDYKVPPSSETPPAVPIPDTEAEANEWLTNNGLYKIDMAAPIKCTTTFESGTLSDSDREKQIDDYMECLTRAWGPALEAAGYTAYRPKVTVFSGEVQTECGTSKSQNAFYCAMDQELYLAQDIAEVMTSKNRDARLLFAWIMAHEYGHAVQGRSGLFGASTLLSHESSKSQALEYYRRAETQADCFAGVVVNSLSKDLAISDEERSGLGDLSFEIGDDQLSERLGKPLEGPGDHGTGANRRTWTERGLGTQQIGTCNTFTAPASEVE